MSAVHGSTPCREVRAACASSAPMLPTAVRSIRPFATAFPISRIDLIFGADSPRRLSFSVRARSRELLSAPDRTEPGKSGLTSPQGIGLGFVGNRIEARLCDDKLSEYQA